MKIGIALVLVLVLAGCGSPAQDSAANQGEAATVATASNDAAMDEAFNLSNETAGNGQ
jgi:uncharacterized protein YceK